MQHFSLTLTSERSSVREARATIRLHLDACGLTPYSDITELLVSELVTNALCHGSGAIRLSLSIRPRTLHCEVRDGSPRIPGVRTARHDEESGRGLFLVQELAHEWGSQVSDTGKAVWFNLELSSPAGRGESAPSSSDRPW
ncbi:ATP-binding protein [Streptomyces sp. NPDC047108]|uniref:ATP-binding protein n=1 Tax=Streptomyces sp. NPDC047108 TaxID=3155025 RepID=UPI003410F3A7